jgi:hypothetical protein
MPEVAGVVARWYEICRKRAQGGQGNLVGRVTSGASKIGFSYTKIN